MKNKVFEQISGELLRLLKEKTLSFTQIMEQMNVHSDKKVMDVIRFWMDNGTIGGNPEGLKLLKPGKLSDQINTPFV